MTFKARAVTTWLWSCCSQLQEQPHSRQANLQLYLRGPVCGTLWKVQECLFPLILTQVLRVSQSRRVRSFGPSHMCVLLQSSLMLYVYCFEFVLLVSRLQNISRMSFPLLPSPSSNHREQDRASNNPSRCFIFAVHSECGQYYFFSLSFTLIVLL